MKGINVFYREYIKLQYEEILFFIGRIVRAYDCPAVNNY